MENIKEFTERMRSQKRIDAYDEYCNEHSDDVAGCMNCPYFNRNSDYICAIDFAIDFANGTIK